MAYHNWERYHSSLGYRTPLAFAIDSVTSHEKPVQTVS
jgi:transposase InsO family protein